MKVARPGLLWIALAGCALAAAAILAYELALPGRPTVAPSVTFTTIKGQYITPEETEGRVLLVNFWSTSCEICMAEMPKMIELHRRYRSLGLQTIAVAMSYDRPDVVLQYADREHLPFNVALDVNGEAAHEYGDVDATPMTFVIDKRGKIVKRYIGEPDFVDLARVLDKALAAPA